MHPDGRSKSVLKVSINLVGQRLWNFLDPGDGKMENNIQKVDLQYRT